MTFDINNIEHYQDSLSHTDKECFMHYVKIINEYIKDLDSRIFYQDNKNKKYILEKGLDIIRHIFLQFLLYSNNLVFTIEITEKGYLYFIEFIQQINEGSNASIDLNINDAILFTYNKTIYDIPLNITTSFNCKDKLIHYVKQYIDIYDSLLSYHISHVDSIKNIDIFLPIIESLIQLPPSFNNIDSITHFIKHMKIKNISTTKLFQLVNRFIEQIAVNNISIEELNKKFMSGYIDTILHLQSNSIIKQFLM